MLGGCQRWKKSCMAWNNINPHPQKHFVKKKKKKKKNKSIITASQLYLYLQNLLAIIWQKYVTWSSKCANTAACQCLVPHSWHLYSVKDWILRFSALFCSLYSSSSQTPPPRAPVQLQHQTLKIPGHFTEEVVEWLKQWTLLIFCALHIWVQLPSSLSLLSLIIAHLPSKTLFVGAAMGHQLEQVALQLEG